jgi:regulation of enolase protein 1 (concanavalin A-like superfamily)
MKKIGTRGSLVLLLTLLTVSAVVWRIAAQPDSAATPRITWQEHDVGATGVKGAAEPTEAGWRVRGAGADIWGGADAFHFVYVPWDGDVELIARVIEVEKTHPWAKAGLMIRASVDQTAPHGFAAWTPEKGAAFIRRLSAGARSRDDSHQAMRMVAQSGKALFQQRGSAGADQATGAITSQPAPRWLRLVRQGSLLRAFDSADGHNWEWLGTDSIDLPSRVYVGLAVTSHDAARLCSAMFEHVTLGAPSLPPAAMGRAGSGDGLHATYYPEMDLSGQGIERVDSTVGFDWGWGTPCEGIGPNHFSVRWEGELEAEFTEPYAIQMVSDDRARIWLNGDLLIDEWYEHAEQASTALVNLEAGKRYLIRIDYFENRGRAVAKLLWSSPSTPLQVIPQSQLHSRITNQNGDGLPDLWKAARGLDPADASVADRIIKGTGLGARQLYANGFEPAAPAKPIDSWLSQDIGRVGPEGSASPSNDIWTIQGSGGDIWANADAFQFVYQPWRGDGQIVARLLDQDKTDPWAKAGVMVRASLQPGAAHVMLATTPEHGMALLRRASATQSTEAQAADSPASQPWLKLVRRGSAISAFASSDGVSWAWIDTQDLAVNEAVYLGLAVCSHDNSKLGAAIFDEVELARPDLEGSVKLSQGSGDGLAATYFDSVTGRAFSRVDSSIDFDWDIDSPVPGISPDFFSVRWEGFLEPESTELYRLHILSDDGARLWLNDRLLIDGWSDHGGLEQSAVISLEAGLRYALKLEYFERAGEAICKLLWSTPSIPKHPIPQCQLYSAREAESSAPPPGNEFSPTPQVSAGTETNAGGASLTAVPNIGRSTADLTPVLTGTRQVEAVAGSDPVARLGRWKADDASLYAVDRRGWVEYELSAPSSNLYRVEVDGASHNPFDLDPGFYLIASVDGEYVGRILLDAMPGRIGTAQVLTPWLKSGPHRFRFFWDNVRQGRSLQIKTVRLLSLLGPDTNGDGVIDWVEDTLTRENGIDLVAQSPATRANDSRPLEISSAISPACLEGRGRFLGLMNIRLADGRELEPQRGTGDRWYANIPLHPKCPTEVEVSFQNGARIERCRISWAPTNLMLARDLVLRKGDSLLLTVRPETSTPDELALGAAEIAVDAAIEHGGSAAGYWVQCFEQTGSFNLRGTYSLGTSQTRSLSVNVLTCSFGGESVAWTRRIRTLDATLPTEAVIEHDPRLFQCSVEALPEGGGQRLRLTVDQPEDRSVTARLGRGGPIMASTTLRGVNVYGVSESGAFYGQTYADGSRRVETAVAQTRVFADVTVRLQIIVAGVMFEDGSLTKTLRAADFDQTGLANIAFIMPPGVQTSNCHVMRAYQNETFMGEY